ncbi:MAG: SusC/RagA family TonB-linked outer membrane protein [Bacteroidales bacterium]|nr:SusC/RagA family TonB-linked outer membrane protein [Bacteroidales bacterium]
MKKHSTLLKVLFLFLSLTFAYQGYAQGVRITGKVTDANDGKTMPGVTIAVKNTTTGTITDIDGNFTLNVNKGAALVFSFIGYNTQEVVIADQVTLKIVMVPSVTTLEEAVVIGYGTVKKSDATGSIAVVSSKDFNRGAITSPQELLVGKSTGVVITSSNGAPGASATIRIRGGSSLSASNDPLIVIDGIPVDNTGISGSANPLSVINPNDIESFTVLKDASATAIYGSRASNGVIIVTTKKGTSAGNKKLVVNYNGTFSLSTVPSTVEVFSGDEFKSLVTDLKDKGYSGLSDKALRRLGTSNTDWQSEIYRSSFSHDHNVAVAGNVKSLPYRASLGYTNQEGILKSTNMNRLSGAFGINPTLLNDHLKVDINFKGSQSKYEFSNSGAVGSAVVYDPTQPVMNGNTRFGGYHTWVNLSDTLEDGSMDPNGYPNPIGVSNPVALLEQTTNNSTVNRYLGNAQFDYKFPFLPELRANLNLAFDKSRSEGINNAPSEAAWTFRSGIGQLIDYTQEKDMGLLDFYLNYVKEVPSILSKIDLTAGYSWQHFESQGTNYSRNSDATIVPDSTEYIKELFLVSFFGRLNYMLNEKYLLTVTLRDDGSSRFSEDNRWGLFPSVALAWKIKEEGFAKNVPNLSEMKLRLGYGVTGQQDIGDNFIDYYPYIATYITGEPTASYQFGDTFYPTLRPNPYDASLKWETTTTYNVGLDYGFFDNRITGAIDYYFRETEDLIAFIPIAVGYNLSNYLKTNVGTLENKGIEFMIDVKPVVTKDVLWTIGYNVSYNRNEITKLTQNNDPDFPGIPWGSDIGGGVGNKIQNNNVGYPAYSFYTFQQVYDQNGMPIEGLYIDRSGEGGNIAGNDDNKYHYKKPAPDVVMGLSSNLRYKRFDAMLSCRVNIGNYVYNNVASDRAVYSSLYNQSGYFNNLPTQVNNTKFNNPQYWSDFYVENASFFRLDNISIGYSFNELFNQKLDARFSFTVQNAFVITKYNGLDPEVDGGIDNNFYPRARTFVFGVNLNF